MCVGGLARPFLSESGLVLQGLKKKKKKKGYFGLNLFFRFGVYICPSFVLDVLHS